MQKNLEKQIEFQQGKGRVFTEAWLGKGGKLKEKLDFGRSKVGGLNLVFYGA